MSGETYLFIDGAYLRKHYTESTQKWFGEVGEINFKQLKESFHAQKCFYYDCLDDMRGEGESESGFESRLAKQEAFFNKIRGVVGSHVRLGSITGTAKNKRQKKVDILLAVDMMNHASRKNLERAILLSGDRDFEPVVNSLIEMGVFVEVAGDIRHTSKDLAWAADNFRPISFRSYYDWSSTVLRSEYSIPNMEANGSPPTPFEASLIKRGSIGDDPCTLHRYGKGGVIFIPSYKGGHSLTITFDDLERLQLFSELEFGDEIKGIW
jgi:uncharacterized LabA/DUF88 family protein